MPAPVPPVDENLQRLLVDALTHLLQAAGYAGGVLLAVTPEHTLAVVSAMEEDLQIDPVRLLRLALEACEARGIMRGGPAAPMNG